MTHYADHLHAQTLNLMAARPGLQYDEAAFEAEKNLTAAGITRGGTMPAAAPVGADARIDASRTLAIQAKWEQASNPALTEAEAVLAADVSLRASHAAYALAMGPGGMTPR